MMVMVMIVIVMMLVKIMVILMMVPAHVIMLNLCTKKGTNGVMQMNLHAYRLDPNETMEQYLKRTRMQSMNVWATEMEIIAAVSMLSTIIYCFRPSGVTFKWLRHSPRVASSRMGEEESIHKQSF